MAERKVINIKDEQEFLAEMRENDRDFVSAMEDSDAKGIDDLKMLMGEDQWDPAIRKIREDARRPVLTQNLLPQFNKNVKNEQRKSRPMVKAIPVDDVADPKTANIVAGLIRNIWYQSQADAVHDATFDSVVDCGRAGWRITPQYDGPESFTQELRIRQVDNPFSIRWDLGCKMFDTSDKQWCHIEEVYTKAAFQKKWPKAKTEGSRDSEGAGTSEAGWFTENGIRVVERWYVEEKKKTIVLLSDGQVKEKGDKLDKFLRLFKGLRVQDERETTIPQIRSCICSGSEILEGPFEFPGQYIPVMIAFGEILNIMGKRHLKSLHRDAKETQQMHNYLWTALVEAAALQPNVPYIGTHTMFSKNPSEWDQANMGGLAKLAFEPDPKAPGMKPERQMPAQIPQGLLQMIDTNQRSMRAVFGMYESDLGMRSNEKSGKAILARQEAGDTGTMVFMSNFLYALQFEGRILADLIPYYYDTPRASMITGLEGDHVKVMLNQATQDKDGKTLMYDVRVGKYDVIITTGPQFASQRQETMQIMTEMMQAAMQTNPAAGSILLMEAIKLLDTPNADLLKKAIKATLDPAVQQIMDQDEIGASEDPKLMAMQQQFEAQMQMVAQQLEAAGVTIQQLQQALSEAQQKVADKSQEAQLKAAELEMKGAEAQQRAKADAEKVQAEVLIAQIQAEAGKEAFDVKSEIAQLAASVSEIGQSVKTLTKSVTSMTESDRETQTAAAVAPVAAQAIQPTVKKVTITGPSGKKYTGEITEEGPEGQE